MQRVPGSHPWLLVAALVAVSGCSGGAESDQGRRLAGAQPQAVSAALLQSRSNTIKAVHASHPYIHNPLIFAGIAYTETQMAHCYSEYYSQVGSAVCAGPTSSDCGGAVTAGYWDAVCSAQAGGLGMWQFDEGNYAQTVSRWSTTGYWNNQPHDILSVSDSTSAAIDFILLKAWASSYTPYFSSYQAMYDWINSLRPGNADWETWLGFLANSYNGQVWGSASWSSTKDAYRSGTSYVHSAMGGDAYWYSSTPAPTTCGTGLYCSPSAIPGSSYCVSGSTQWYCCPSGQTIVNGACSGSAIPACGSGLYCAGSSIPGASACMSGSTTAYCCPSGQTIVNGACSGSAPACGTGLYCSPSAIPGSSFCVSGTTQWYCCPAGQTIVNGVCSTSSVPACGSGLYCAGSSIPGASACMSGSTTAYCCPSGQTIVNGACSGSGTPSGFCAQSCGCDASGNNCNFGTANTDSWCKCCAANCGGNQGACVQQGYQGDNGFPAGTSRQCGCVNPYGNGHDFNLADNANLGACYQNLRANSGVTAGYQTIWHPGASGCSSGQHMHVLASSASGVNRFGIDCLGQTTYGGQACTLDATGCYFLWQGAQ